MPMAFVTVAAVTVAILTVAIVTVAIVTAAFVTMAIVIVAGLIVIVMPGGAVGGLMGIRIDRGHRNHLRQSCLVASMIETPRPIVKPEAQPWTDPGLVQLARFSTFSPSVPTGAVPTLPSC